MAMHHPQNFQFEAVKVKEEFDEKLNPVEDSTYCRCCLRHLSVLEVQFAVTEESLSMFQDIIQLTLQASPIAGSFCEICLKDIENFSRFKNIATARQQIFIDMSANGGNINEIHEMDLPLQPQVKIEEPGDVLSVTSADKPHSIKEEQFEEIDDNNDSHFDDTTNDFKDLEPEFPTTNYLNLSWNPPEQTVQKGKSTYTHDGYQFILNSVQGSKMYWVCKYHGKSKIKCKARIITDKESNFLKYGANYGHNHEQDTVEMMLEYARKRHDTKVQPGPQICPICGKIFKSSLDKHIEAIHNKTRRFFCDICEFSSYNKAYLIYHMKQIHLTADIQCPECDFVTLSKCKLKLHMKMHSMDYSNLHITVKAKPIYTLDGYQYILNSEREKKMYWICRNASKLKCKARIITDTDGNFLKFGATQTHNHDPCTNETILKDIKTWIKKMAIEDIDKKPYKILQELKSKYPEHVDRLGNERSLKTIIHRARRRSVKKPKPMQQSTTYERDVEFPFQNML